jgi:hypothetical protein
MRHINSMNWAKRTGSLVFGVLAAIMFVLGLAAPKLTAQQPNTPTDVPTIPPGSAYRVTTLLSDIPGLAPVLDPLLVNPWGIAASSSSPFWIANNATSTTQLVRGDVGGAPVVLNPSPQTITIPGGLPTGVVRNSTTDFQITPPGGGSPAAAAFIFVSETGNIVAWNGSSGSAAQNVVSMPVRFTRDSRSPTTGRETFFTRRTSRTTTSTSLTRRSLSRQTRLSLLTTRRSRPAMRRLIPGPRRLALRHVCEGRLR